MRFAVIVFPGSNCDHDAYHVLKHRLNVFVDFVWHQETDLSKYDAILIRFNIRQTIYVVRAQRSAEKSSFSKKKYWVETIVSYK